MNVSLLKDATATAHSSTVLVLASNGAAADFHSLADGFNVVVVVGATPRPSEIFLHAKTLGTLLEQERAKRLTVLGIGEGGHSAQALAIFYPRLVRRLVLVDATTKQLRNDWTSWVERFERKLPLGLPLRASSDDFDSRPLLHRIHCPTLVAVSPDAGPYVRAEGDYLHAHIPNAWFLNLTTQPVANGQASPALGEALKEFLQVATKRPQKAA